jgi:toxin YoeB
MITAWTEEGWDDYLYWQSNDRKKLKRINDLIKDIKRNGPFHGIGRPEPLKENLAATGHVGSRRSIVWFIL